MTECRTHRGAHLAEIREIADRGEALVVVRVEFQQGLGSGLMVVSATVCGMDARPWYSIRVV